MTTSVEISRHSRSGYVEYFLKTYSPSPTVRVNLVCEDSTHTCGGDYNSGGVYFLVQVKTQNLEDKARSILRQEYEFKEI